MKRFIESDAVKKICGITQAIYHHGWGERNGGNISLIIPEAELREYCDIRVPGESGDNSASGKAGGTGESDDSSASGKAGTNKAEEQLIQIGFDARPLAGLSFLVTASGSYFRNIAGQPADDLGLLRITEDGQSAEVLWGFESHGRPTSEFASHLLSHIVCLKKNKNHRALIHTHPDHLIAMSYTCPLSEKEFTRTLWQMHSEAMMIFPEGLGVLPYMQPGSDALGEATAEKLAQYNGVIWAHHGMFATGSDLDEAFGLVETAEKAATVYTLAKSQGGIIRVIEDEDLIALAKSLGKTANPNFF